MIFVEVAILIPFCLINVGEGLRQIDREIDGDGPQLHPPPRAHPLARDAAAARPVSIVGAAHRLRHRLENRAGVGAARRPQRPRLAHAARPDGRRQHDLPCDLLRHCGDLCGGRALGDPAARAALCTTVRRRAMATTMSDELVVRTSAGELRGQRESGISVFRGVPYATAAGRCAALQAAAADAGLVRGARRRRRWTGRAAGPLAPRPCHGRFRSPAKRGLPDPHALGAARRAQGAGRGVAPWRRLLSGAGSLPWYSGATFARERRSSRCRSTIAWVRSVSSYLPGISHGNLGMQDQVAALRWVRDNIAAFGGDPDNVTSSASPRGGMSITALMAMPSARGLFRRAIMQSAPLRSLTARAPRKRRCIGRAMKKCWA